MPRGRRSTRARTTRRSAVAPVSSRGHTPATSAVAQTSTSPSLVVSSGSSDGHAIAASAPGPTTLQPPCLQPPCHWSCCWVRQELQAFSASQSIPSTTVSSSSGGTDPAALPPQNQITLKAANIDGGGYLYTNDLLKLEDCREEGSPVQWPICPSPIQLQNSICSHPDHRFAAYIHAGLSQGFRIGFDRRSSSLTSASGNHPSASTNRLAASEYIHEELEAGRLLGPIEEQSLPMVHTSPIGLIPKAHQPNKWRMIVDLSSPRGHSVNDGISPELASIKYASVDDAVEQILQLGKGTKLVKLDLKNAYRIIPRTIICWQSLGRTSTGLFPLA